MAKAADIAMDFPNLRKHLGTTAAAEYAAAPDSTFTFGLQTILAGLESRL
jgi:hypothetical protein